MKDVINHDICTLIREFKHNRPANPVLSPVTIAILFWSNIRISLSKPQALALLPEDLTSRNIERRGRNTDSTPP
jgi:hypothetical protein